MMTSRYPVFFIQYYESSAKMISCRTKRLFFWLSMVLIQQLSIPFTVAQENLNFLNAPLQQAQELGDSLLIGEKCQLSPRQDVEQTLLSQQNAIFCNGLMIGTLNSQAELPSVDDKQLSERLKATLTQFAQSRASVVVSSKMQCQQPHWLEQSPQQIMDPPILAFPCELGNGNWPHLVLIRSEGKKIFVAEGPPATLPILIKAVTISMKQSPNFSASLTEQTRRLKEIWGKPIRFYNPRDLDYYEKILSEARVANSQGNYDQSEALFRRALQLQSQFLGEDSELLINTLLDLALNTSNNGRYEEADGLFRRGERLVQKSTRPEDKARLYSYQGYHAANQRNYQNGLQFAKAAVRQWRKANEEDNTALGAVFSGQVDDHDNLMQGELAMALNFQANMSLRNEDFVGAATQAGEAFKIIQDTESVPTFWKTNILVTLGDISLAQQRISAAVKYYKTALKYQRDIFGDSPLTVKILTKLATGLQDEGFNTESILTFREAIKVAKELPNGPKGVLSADQLSNYAEAAIAIVPTLKTFKEQQGLFNEVYDAFQLQSSSVMDKTLAMTSAKMRISDPNIAKLVDQLQSLERKRDADKAQLASETSLMDDQRSKLIEDRLTSEIKEHNQQIKSIQIELEKKYPRYTELTGGKFVSLSQLQSYLDPQEAIALFLLGNQASYLQLITKKDIHIVQIPLTQDQIGEDVRSLRKALDAQQGSVSEFDLNKSYSLYESIFGKVGDYLQDKKHLIIVPTGPLASLPFSILVTKSPTSRDYTQAEWFIRKVAISHAPSLASFYDQRSTTPIKQASLPFLGFGNPVLAPLKKSVQNTTQTTVNPRDKKTPQLPPTAVELCRESGPIATEVLLAMPSLPDTANELQQIGKIMSMGQTPALYLGKDATEDNLRKLELNEYRVLYFATHGLLPGELRCQSEPGLVLTPPAKIEKDTLKSQDGLVDASEIAQFKLNADLVVLSACNTAGGNGKFGGEALSGLAEAFFYAGARNLLVTHWSVSSSATVQLMQKTFSLLGPKLEGGASMALQQAQIQMVANPEFSHPIFWGAFDLVGDGAPDGVGSSRQLVITKTTSSNAM